VESVIKETLEIAERRFKAFGFSEEQCERLLLSGKDNIERELQRLRKILTNKHRDINKCQNTLHALKGLFSNLGNHRLAEALLALEGHRNCDAIRKALRNILYLQDI